METKKKTPQNDKQFVAPVSRDLCEFVILDHAVQINNIDKGIKSVLTFHEVKEAARKYPESDGWVRVHRAVVKWRGE